MRTTVILKDELVARAKSIAKEKTLSGILNASLAAWIRQQSRKQIEERLALEYRESSGDAQKIACEFAAPDQEGWPSW